MRDLSRQRGRLRRPRLLRREGDGDPLQGVPPFASKMWIDDRSPRTDELLQILLKGKDKMVGQEGRITEEQARQLLDFVRSIAVQYS